MNDLAKQALDVVLSRSLVSLQQHNIPSVSGRDLIRLSCASGNKLGRHLGLLGDLAPLLLRWGHSQQELHRSLTCCPERIELLQSIDPDWLVKNVNSYLIDLLDVGGHLDKVTPDWLYGNIRCCNDLMFCLGTGNHLEHLSPEWIVSHFKHDSNKVAALIHGGQLHDVSPDWIFANIRSYNSAFWALTTKMDITAVPPEWLKSKVPYFEDLSLLPDVLGHMGSEMIAWFMSVYESQYRDPNCAASDLAYALIGINETENDHYGCSFDIVTLLTALRGVPYKELYSLLDVIHEVTGIVDLCDSSGRPDLSRLEILDMYLVSLGWTGDSEFDKSSRRVLCQLMMNKWVPIL